MNRRDALAVLAALAATPASAQRKERAVVGVIRATAYAGERDGTKRLVAALKRRGYEEGRNLVVDARYADGKMERLPVLARELAARQLDVVVIVGLAAAQAWQATGSRIPVVFFGNFDPVRGGLVKSLAQPGGTMTGVLIAAQGTLAAKRLEFLYAAIPGATRIGVLAPEDRNFVSQLEEVKRAAQPMGVTLTIVEATGADYEKAFRALSAAKVQALFVGGHTFFARDSAPIIALAAKYRMPATYEWPEQAEDGGLMGYGADIDELQDRVALLVDRILNGASPAELPVEQPTKAELVVNLKTAKALGLTIPPALLQRADRVLE